MTYKHGNWYCKPANEAEAREIVERAVASGAKNRYDLAGDQLNSRYYGVYGGILTLKHRVYWTDAIVTEYTIEQVRELFPLPGERVKPSQECDCRPAMESEGCEIFVQDTKWNGEGLPPVGSDFEFSYGGVSWSEAVMLFNDGITCLIASKKHPINRSHYKSDDPCLRFSPLRSERERWVESAEAATKIIGATNAIGIIYDALKSGDLKAPEVE